MRFIKKNRNVISLYIFQEIVQWVNSRGIPCIVLLQYVLNIMENLITFNKQFDGHN